MPSSNLSLPQLEVSCTACFVGFVCCPTRLVCFSLPSLSALLPVCCFAFVLRYLRSCLLAFSMRQGGLPIVWADWKIIGEETSQSLPLPQPSYLHQFHLAQLSGSFPARSPLLSLHFQQSNRKPGRGRLMWLCNNRNGYDSGGGCSDDGSAARCVETNNRRGTRPGWKKW